MSWNHGHLHGNTPLTSSSEKAFKLNAYHCQAHNTVLRDMLESPALIKSSIPIDASSETPSIFLDFMTCWKVNNPHRVNTWLSLLGLCDKYDCAIIRRRIKDCLRIHAHQAPWDTFCIASHLNDFDLARKAMKHMGQDVALCDIELGKISLDDASQPTLPYLLGLLKSRIASNYGSIAEWRSLSKEFTPVS